MQKWTRKRKKETKTSEKNIRNHALRQAQGKNPAVPYF
jgi:hypothetical protein